MKDLNKDLRSKNSPRSSTLEKSRNGRKWRPRHIPQKRKKKKNKKSKYKPSRHIPQKKKKKKNKKSKYKPSRHIPQKKKKKKNKKSKYKPSDESLKALCYTSDDCLPKKGFQEFCSRSGLHFKNTKFEINIVMPLRYDIAQ